MNNFDSLSSYNTNVYSYNPGLTQSEQPSNQSVEGILSGKKVGKVKEQLCAIAERIDHLVNEALEQNGGVNPFQNPEFNATIHLIVHDSNLPKKYIKLLSEKVAALSENLDVQQKSLAVETAPPLPAESFKTDAYTYYQPPSSPSSNDPYAYYSSGHLNTPEGYADFPNVELSPPSPGFDDSSLGTTENQNPISEIPTDSLSFPSSNLKDLVDNGLEYAIKDYVNSQPSVSSVERLLVQGPQIKNEETFILEKVIHDLLSDPNQLVFEVIPRSNQCYIKDSNGELLKDSTGKNVELSELLKKANINHISLSKEQLSAFRTFLNNSSLSNDITTLNSRSMPTNPKLGETDNKLTRTEKAALQLYISENHYSSIQKLLQGRIDEFGADYDSTNVDSFLKSYLLVAAVGVSALNRLPDFESTNESQFLYRYDMSLPESKLQERIQNVRDGGKVSTETAFISTSHTRPAEFFKDGNVITLFENCKAKSVEKLSPLDEREVTMPPTQVQWKYHHEFTDSSGKTIHLFIARAVTTPTEASTRLPDEPVPPPA